MVEQLKHTPIKVRDFWQECLYIEGKNPEQPEVSVILPTFRRYASGLLQRAVESVLQQSFENFELIVVDDGSTDGSADYLRSIVAKDGRVSYYRFRKNSGLPAAAVDFALMHSRARVFAFIFDDDLWYKDALGTLFREISKSGRKTVYGKVRWFFRDPMSGRQFWRTIGDSQITPSSLLKGNMVSNHAVMVRKEVLDRVGMYDPHILVRRLTDWDLWRRVIRHFPMYRINHWIGEAWGPATADSLGATVSSNWNAMLKYMMIERDERLRQNVISDFVVNDFSVFAPNFSDTELLMVNKVFEEYYAQVGD